MNLPSRGYLEADADAGRALTGTQGFACHPQRKLPHIILLHDESSFDITAAPGIKVPPGYGRHFQSFDGKARKLVVEGVGGPSWFTEYNVLTGLSARSYGRFATSVTRIAAGRVSRGLPHSVGSAAATRPSACIRSTALFSIRAASKQRPASRIISTCSISERATSRRDSFYFDRAVDFVERERGHGPLFIYVYTVANHFPWDKRLRPELTPDWHDLGNGQVVDEYIRRQEMTAADYRDLLEELARRFPAKFFLIIRVWRSSASVWCWPDRSFVGHGRHSQTGRGIRRSLPHNILRDRRSELCRRPMSPLLLTGSMPLICHSFC